MNQGFLQFNLNLKTKYFNYNPVSWSRFISLPSSEDNILVNMDHLTRKWALKNYASFRETHVLLCVAMDAQGFLLRQQRSNHHRHHLHLVTVQPLQKKKNLSSSENIFRSFLSPQQVVVSLSSHCSRLLICI